jgi:hypothetical protein
LVHRENAALDVLTSHADHVAAPLPRIEQKCEREGGPRAYGVERFKLRNVIFGSCPKAAG